MALMNHNAEHCMDVDARNKARDWGEQQLHACADWGVQLSFRQAWIYLWLNYHTVHHRASLRARLATGAPPHSPLTARHAISCASQVHHLFPKLDFSHHPAAQRIVMQTCREHGVKYVAADSPAQIYREMVQSFATPQSLCKAILVYGGDI